MVINDKVYDISDYASRHPGGKIILDFVGADGTNAFYKYHPWVNHEHLLKDHKIGRYNPYKL